MTDNFTVAYSVTGEANVRHPPQRRRFLHFHHRDARHVVGRVISGITAASISTSFAYIADVAPPEKRAGAFGLLGAAFGVGFVVGPGLGGLVRPAIKLMGDRATLIVGLACGIFGFAGYGLAPAGAWFWCAMPLAALWGLSSPPLQSMMSQEVDGTEQGKLQGANTSVSGIAQLIGPSLFTLAFSSAVSAGTMPGVPFLIASALVAGALVVGIWTVRLVRSEAVPAN